jgi:hypothetical protein
MVVRPESNQETSVSSIPSGYEGISIKKKVEPKGSLKLSHDEGLKITDYREGISHKEIGILC